MKHAIKAIMVFLAIVSAFVPFVALASNTFDLVMTSLFMLATAGFVAGFVFIDSKDTAEMQEFYAKRYGPRN